jgi:hypothetical protein
MRSCLGGRFGFYAPREIRLQNDFTSSSAARGAGGRPPTARGMAPATEGSQRRAASSSVDLVMMQKFIFRPGRLGDICMWSSRPPGAS